MFLKLLIDKYFWVCMYTHYQDYKLFPVVEICKGFINIKG